MGTQIGVSYSQNRNTRKAAREAAEGALAQAGIERPDFAIVFMTVGHDPEKLLPVIREVIGDAPLTGSSVGGCIAPGFADESAYCVEVTVIASDELRFDHARVANSADDPHAAGRELGQALKPHVGEDAVAMLVFADAFTLNYTALTAGLDETLGCERFIPRFGGGSSNDVQSTRTFQFHDDEIYEQGAVVTLISSSGPVLSTVTHGCYPLSLRQTVTRADKNWILELDGKPALDVISSYVTEEESQNWLMAVNNLCLGLEVPEPLAGEYDKLCIRYMVGRDPDAKSVMIQTEVEEGESIWSARRESDKIFADAERAVASLREQIGDRTPKLMLQFECLGRGRFLFSESVKLDLVERTQRAAPAGVPWLGAYVSGEIAPIGQTDMFHNYTAVVIALL